MLRVLSFVTGGLLLFIAAAGFMCWAFGYSFWLSSLSAGRTVYIDSACTIGVPGRLLGIAVFVIPLLSAVFGAKLLCAAFSRKRAGMKAGATLAIAFVVAVLIPIAVWYSQPSSTTVSLCTSSAGVGEAAIVLTHHWDGPFEKFYVTDPKYNHGRPAAIASLLESCHFDGVTWSRDGTIVAVRTNGILAYSYDFKNHAPISAPSTTTNINARTTGIIWPTPSAQEEVIQKALVAHGGPTSAGAGAPKRVNRWGAARYDQ
jgi:hypothetical protein